jgi:uncharacterized membrane-anchored protein YjiN (DUF445 family)
MKRFATGILILAAVIYVPARLYEAMYPALGYLRAFCEAAMIGGLADWFAVTALFRYPLGVRLPHTAIIPNNKERIADALARFVEFNFLSSEVVTEKLSKVDFALLAGNWMADPQRSGPPVAKVIEFLPRIFGMAGAEPLRRFAREHCAASLEDTDLAPAALELLRNFIAEHRRGHLVDELMVLADSHLGTNETEIRASLVEKTARIWPSLGLEADAAQRLIAATAQTFVALRGEAGQEARQQLAELLFDVVEQLRASPTFPAKLDSFKRSLLGSPVWSACVQSVWERIGTRLQEDLRRSDSAFRLAVQGAVCGLGENLVGNMMVRMVLNMQLRQFFVGFVEKRRHHAAELIAETMRKWDAVTMSGRIEDAIGRDLQYIRINGTVIGGLIGVVIHALSSLVLR